MAPGSADRGRPGAGRGAEAGSRAGVICVCRWPVGHQQRGSGKGRWIGSPAIARYCQQSDYYATWAGLAQGAGSPSRRPRDVRQVGCCASSRIRALGGWDWGGGGWSGTPSAGHWMPIKCPVARQSGRPHPMARTTNWPTDPLIERQFDESMPSEKVAGVKQQRSEQ